MPKLRDASILRRLQYFEATARHGSVSGAAEELGVSASAVSHQLADLRRVIGEELFVKSGRQVVLTNAGRLMAQRLATAFSILDSSVNSAIGSEHVTFRLAACSAFGPFWIIPRLARFRADNPDIHMNIRLYDRDPELTQTTADCIVTAQEVRPGYAYVDLFVEKAIVVAAPGKFSKGRLGRGPLITTWTEPHNVGGDWRALEAASTAFEMPADPDWVYCSHYVLALEAAKAGLGAAIIPDFVAASALEAGQLVRLDIGSYNPEGRTYRACYKESRAGEPEVQAVTNWLRRMTRNGSVRAVAR